MKLRRDGVCAGCQVEVPAGTVAYWFASERVVRCATCVDTTPDDATERPPAHTSHATDSDTPTPAEDVAGGSAQQEYDRRSARERAGKEKRVAEDAEWRAAIKEERPVLGRIATAFTPKPVIGPESQATRAWKTGAEGERRVAEVLADVVGVEVLHDRRVPGSKANIDHIAVGPAGVFVIDAKKYQGAVEVRDVGSLFRTDERLYVDNRDRTKLVDGVLGQIEVVRAALGPEFDEVSVSGVLCFVGCEWGWFMRPNRITGVTALWPTALPDHVAAPGPLTERVPAISDRLRQQLPPAT